MQPWRSATVLDRRVGKGHAPLRCRSATRRSRDGGQAKHSGTRRRINGPHRTIGHPAAGNPGRKELDDTQEINYPPIMRKLLDIGYKGFVGQEFIPVGDPMQGLIDAVELCDV